jgi:hypothetical protein
MTTMEQATTAAEIKAILREAKLALRGARRAYRAETYYTNLRMAKMFIERAINAQVQTDGRGNLVK